MSLLLAVPNKFHEIMSTYKSVNTYPSKKSTENAFYTDLERKTKDEDNNLKNKIKQVMELTNKTSDEAVFALHDADNDVNRAVNMLLESFTSYTSLKSDWKTLTKKKKSHGDTKGDRDSDSSKKADKSTFKKDTNDKVKKDDIKNNQNQNTEVIKNVVEKEKNDSKENHQIPDKNDQIEPRIKHKFTKGTREFSTSTRRNQNGFRSKTELSRMNAPQETNNLCETESKISNEKDEKRPPYHFTHQNKRYVNRGRGAYFSNHGNRPMFRRQHPNTNNNFHNKSKSPENGTDEPISKNDLTQNNWNEIGEWKAQIPQDKSTNFRRFKSDSFSSTQSSSVVLSSDDTTNSLHTKNHHSKENNDNNVKPASSFVEKTTVVRSVPTYLKSCKATETIKNALGIGLLNNNANPNIVRGSNTITHSIATQVVHVSNDEQNVLYTKPKLPPLSKIPTIPVVMPNNRHIPTLPINFEFGVPASDFSGISFFLDEEDDENEINDIEKSTNKNASSPTNKMGKNATKILTNNEFGFDQNEYTTNGKNIAQPVCNTGKDCLPETNSKPPISQSKISISTTNVLATINATIPLSLGKIFGTDFKDDNLQANPESINNVNTTLNLQPNKIPQNVLKTMETENHLTKFNTSSDKRNSIPTNDFTNNGRHINTLNSMTTTNQLNHNNKSQMTVPVQQSIPTLENQPSHQTSYNMMGQPIPPQISFYEAGSGASLPPTSYTFEEHCQIFKCLPLDFFQFTNSLHILNQQQNNSQILATHQQNDVNYTNVSSTGLANKQPIMANLNLGNYQNLIPSNNMVSTNFVGTNGTSNIPNNAYFMNQLLPGMMNSVLMDPNNNNISNAMLDKGKIATLNAANGLGTLPPMHVNHNFNSNSSLGGLKSDATNKTGSDGNKVSPFPLRTAGLSNHQHHNNSLNNINNNNFNALHAPNNRNNVPNKYAPHELKNPMLIKDLTKTENLSNVVNLSPLQGNIPGNNSQHGASFLNTMDQFMLNNNNSNNIKGGVNNKRDNDKTTPINNMNNMGGNGQNMKNAYSQNLNLVKGTVHMPDMVNNTLDDMSNGNLSTITTNVTTTLLNLPPMPPPPHFLSLNSMDFFAGAAGLPYQSTTSFNNNLSSNVPPPPHFLKSLTNNNVMKENLNDFYLLNHNNGVNNNNSVSFAGGIQNNNINMSGDNLSLSGTIAHPSIDSANALKGSNLISFQQQPPLHLPFINAHHHHQLLNIPPTRNNIILNHNGSVGNNTNSNNNGLPPSKNSILGTGSSGVSSSSAGNGLSLPPSTLTHNDNSQKVTPNNRPSLTGSSLTSGQPLYWNQGN